jgi:Flp pilus assembly protein TadG
MTRFMLRLRDEERGATVVIVVLCLVAMFGMLVLVVDVGGLLVRRRAMVNGSDAAALAAAEQCSTTGSTLAQAETQADTLAIANVANMTASSGSITDSANCGTKNKGYVTVQYTSPQHLFFAPVLGASNSGNVTTAATAGWGPAGSANPVPIILNVGTFQGACNLPLPDTAIGTKCYLWYDNNLFNGSSFGFLQLDQWNVPATANCSSSGGANDINNWINGLWNGGQLGLNYPLPTYVCVRSGNISTAWFDTLAARTGDTLFFPINDWDGSVTGYPQLLNSSGTQIDKFNVIGFAGLKLEAVYKANQTGPVQSACPTTGSFPIPNPTNGSTTDLLVVATPCQPFTRIVSVSASGDGGCCQAGNNKDYTLTKDANGNITGMMWNKAETNVTVSMMVEQVGPCGPPPPNASGNCIVVSWQGAQFGGETPNGGADFGLRAVALCDRTLGSCPDQK